MCSAYILRPKVTLFLCPESDQENSLKNEFTAGTLKLNPKYLMEIIHLDILLTVCNYLVHQSSTNNYETAVEIQPDWLLKVPNHGGTQA